MYPTAAVLLPTWWRAICVVLLLGVAIVLGLRAVRTAGAVRWWHVTYTVVAAGMVVMYAANPMDTPEFNPPALVVFVVALLGVVATAPEAVRRRHDGRAATPWLVAMADTATLAYIQIPADVRPVIICVLFACYLAVQVGLRLTVAVRALRRAPQRASRALVDPAGRPVDEAGPRRESRRADAVVPVALAVLALVMLYMLSV